MPPFAGSWRTELAASLTSVNGTRSNFYMATSSDSSDLDSPVEPRPPKSPYQSLYPGRGRSLSGIAFRSFVLGTILGLSLLASVQLLIRRSPYWRPSLICAFLAVFHFLEFFTFAKNNLPRARVSAFLLSSNGWAYNFAHLVSFAEFFLRRLFTSEYWPGFLTFPDKVLEWRAGSSTYQPYAAVAGILLMLLGQSVRSTAMAEAGESFNHLVQYKKRDEHKLITSGVYSWLRHPAYFGFFWYVVGAQLVMGNPLCLFGLSYATWRFFAFRIPKEEQYLVYFFGQEYHDYCNRTKIWIPFLK